MSHTEKNLSFRLGSLALSVYVPSFLISTGIGIVVPIFPLLSQDLGASIALTGVVVAMRSVGTAVFDIPAGILLDHLKKRHTMVMAVSGISLFAGIIGFSSSIAALALFSFLMGGLESIYTISRLSYIKETVPIERRGQSFSMMGGVMRVGRFVGPIIGGVVGSTYGLHATFLAQALVTLFAFLFVFGFLKPVGDGRARGEKKADRNHPLHRRLKNTIIVHRRSFYTTGLSMVALGILRSGREILIPLWGNIIGLDVAEIGLIVGLSSAIDMTLFYPVGLVMDRLGRKWTAVPCFLLLSLSLVLVPLSRGFSALLLIGLFAGFANGLGSGINMVLSTDLAPKDSVGEFLGIWRLITDVGMSGGPLLIGVVAQAFSMLLASLFTGGLGVAGAAIMVFLVSETLPGAKPAGKPVRPRSFNG